MSSGWPERSRILASGCARRAPLSLYLVGTPVEPDLIALDADHEIEWDVVVKPAGFGITLRQLDLALRDVIDRADMAAVRTDDGGVLANLAGIDHGCSPC